MDTIQAKLVGAGVLFLLIYLSGFGLSRAGKPYPSGIVTVHKLISLGEVGVLYLVLRQFQQTASLTSTQLTVAWAAGGLFAITILSGGLLSTNKSMPAILLLVHKAAPHLTLAATAATLYLMLAHPMG